MIVNGRKTKEMIIGPILKDPPPDLLLNDTVVDRVSTFKLIGVHVSNDLKWTEHVRAVTSKASSRLHFLKQLKRAGCTKGDLMYFYISAVRPITACTVVQAVVKATSQSNGKCQNLTPLGLRNP